MQRAIYLPKSGQYDSSVGIEQMQKTYPCTKDIPPNHSSETASAAYLPRGAATGLTGLPGRNVVCSSIVYFRKSYRANDASYQVATRCCQMWGAQTHFLHAGLSLRAACGKPLRP